MLIASPLVARVRPGASALYLLSNAVHVAACMQVLTTALGSPHRCGLVPLLSNARVSNEHRDLMMPDFSFAPFSYLTNLIDADSAAAFSVIDEPH